MNKQNQAGFVGLLNKLRRVSLRAAHSPILVVGLILVGIGLTHWLIAANAAANVSLQTGNDIWQAIGLRRVEGVTESARAFRLNKGALESALSRAPKERSAPLSQSQAIITLPMPDGSFSRFRIEESSVFEPALAARYPEIKSYRGQGIDIRTATIRFDWTPLGFHALMLAGDQSVSVHPVTNNPDADYVSYQVSDARKQFTCGVIDQGRLGGAAVREIKVATGDQLRTYRVAISTTGEFTQDVGGGTVAGALAALNTILNGINAIYERDLTVHINLIAGLEPVIFTNAATDPYTNGNTGAMFGQVKQTLGANIPNANYDFGHVIGTNSGGLAGVGVVCDNTDDNGPAKAAGVSAAALPLGSSNNIGLISHEFGHMFGAPHAQNANCERSPLNAIEPGSGVTIMSYSGVCPPNNTVPIGQLRFHAWSLALMNNYIATQTCQVNTASGNGVPTVNGGPDRTIPVNTPFTLTAAGGDPNAGDVPNLTYTWEQVDPGQLNAGATDFPNPPYQDQLGDPVTTTRPILTALASTTNPARTFPQLTYILNNANDPPDQVNGLFTAEELPRVGRTVNLRVTIRDNRAGAGGVNDDLVTLTVNGASGPFLVTAPNTAIAWTVGSQQNVTWSVNNTDNAPVSCANVKISLSTDGGLTFPIVLSAGTPNDGAETITVPNGLSTPNARVKVEAVGNIFFDVSNVNFTINAGAGCPFVASVLPGAGNAGAVATISGTGFTGVTGVKFSNNVTAAFTVVNDTTITATVPAGSVTGPITLTKAGCPDVTTAAFTVCPNAVQTAQVDDGGGEIFFGAGGTTQFFVNRLTPAAYPATLTQVLIQLDSFTVPVGSAMTVLAGANPGGTANIDGVAFQTVAGTTGPDGAFKTFNVPQLTINSGDFVVGYSIASGGSPGFADTTTNQGRSYSSSNGTSFGTRDGNLLIRASYHTNCGAPTTCPSVANITPNNGAVGAAVTITGANFTGVTAVRFSNNVTATFNIVNDTTITTTVPAGAVTGPITISKAGCPDVQTATFTIGGGTCPTVTNINPTNGAVGAAVTITGTNFTGVTGVRFSNNVTATFTVVNATTITTTVPAGAVTGPITISKTACADVQTATFTVGGGCPTITVNPATLPDGSINTAYNQTLTGSGGTGPYTFSLTAGTNSETRFNATGPVAIPDNNPTGADLPVTVTGITSPITKVTVSVHLTHTFDGDLTLQLIGPDGTTVNLSNNRGDEGDNYGSSCVPDGQRTLFDDAAATAIGAGTAPFVGSFRPEQVLSAFNGKSGAAVNGAWKLHVVDGVDQDTGAIQCVSIFISQTAPAPGLSLAANGTLSGTPTTIGTFNFTVQATDANQCTGTRAYALTITATAACPTVTNMNPTSGAVGAAVTITGTNFTGVTGVKFANNVTATFTVVNATTITTTVPAGAVTGPITISKAGCADVQSATFTVGGCPTITINPATLPNGNVNAAYNQALTGTGGTGPYTFSLTAGTPVATRFNAAGPVAIPDNNPTGVDLPVTVTGITSPITKVTVSVHLTHTFDGDLTLQLIGPDGTTVNLSNNRGDEGDNYGSSCVPDGQRTLFDDAAATAIGAGTAPFVGSFRPEQVLSAFNGKSGAAVNGAWKLHVVDGVDQDTGSIECVSIFISQTQPAPGLLLAANGTLSGTPTTAGTFNFTVQATDANQCTGTRAYALTIGTGGNTAPTITAAAPFPGRQGDLSAVPTIANVSDPDQPLNTLIMTVNGSSGATVNGVTLSDISVSAGGVVAGVIVVGCNATAASFMLTATDNQSASASAMFPVTVTPNTTPTLSYNSQSVATGGALTVNPATGPSDNGEVNSIVVQSQGTYTGTVSVSSLTGVVSLSGANPPGNHTITIRATDNCGAFTNASFTVNVGGGCPTITVNPASLPNGAVAAGYNQTITASGGAPAYNFTVLSGTLPTGLNLSTGGVLSGTPTAQGAFNFTVTATDANNCTGQRAYSITIGPGGNCIPVSISTTLTGATGGTITIPVTVGDLTGRGVVSYDFTLAFNTSVLTLQNPAIDAAGTLSSGMVVTPNTSVPGQLTVSGFSTTPLSGAGTLLNLKFNIVGSASACSALTWANFKFNEKDPCATTVNGNFCVQNTFSISGVVSYCIATAKKVAGVLLTAATQGVTNTTDGSGNYSLSGLNGGAVTVTPTKTGNVNGISSFDASQVAQHVAGIITLNSCQITAGDASNNGALSSFDAALIAQYVSGIVNAGNITGTWKFTPANRAYSPLSSNQTGQNFDAILVGDVSGNWTPPLSNTASFEPRSFGTDGIAVQVPISLPVLSGGPGGTVTIPITVGNLTGAGFVSYDLDLVFNQSVLQLQATPVDATGTLSAGLTITPNVTTGRLRVSAFGVNALSGSGTLLNLKFNIVGAAGSSTALTWQSFIFNEEPQTNLTNGNFSVPGACGPVTVNPASPTLPSGTAGQPYSQTFTGSGGTGPYTFAVSAGSLPAGLTLASGGGLTGTPTGFGGFTFTVSATDSTGCQGERQYTLSICPIITVNPAPPLANVVRGVPITTVTFTGSGGAGPYTFTVSAGALPAGLSLASGGALTGTPTQTGSFNFTVSASDANSCFGERGYTLTVVCPTITLSPATVPNPAVGVAYNQTISASGGAAPYTFSVSAGALPTGLALSSGGVLSGTPTSAGPFNFTVTASDAGLCTGSQNYAVTVSGGIVTGLQYYPLPRPIRLLDTRQGATGCFTPGTPLQTGSIRTQLARTTCDNITIPANAQAVVGNATVVNFISAGGFITLWPTGAQQPTVSNLNYSANQIIPNAFTVGLGASGEFDIFASGATDFIVDITGYYAPPGAGGLYYHPLPAPIRLLDTRSQATGCFTPGAPLQTGSTRTQLARTTCNGITIPANAQAVVGNGTVVNFQSSGGFITLYPTGAQQPTVSNLNYSANQIIPNAFTVGLGANGEFNIFASGATDFIVDITGYFSPDAPADVNGAVGLLYNPLPRPIRLLDTRPQATGCDTPQTPLIGGGTRTELAQVTCDNITIPASARAVVGNATVVNFISGGGFITLWPTGAAQPTVSNLNYGANQIIPNAFTVGLGPAGQFNIFASAGTHFIVDLTGYFAP